MPHTLNPFTGPQRSRGQLIKASAIHLVSASVKEALPSRRFLFGFDLYTNDRNFSFRAFGRHARRDQLQKVQRGQRAVIQPLFFTSLTANCLVS